jgi:hypothetical protein
MEAAVAAVLATPEGSDMPAVSFMELLLQMVGVAP